MKKIILLLLSLLFLSGCSVQYTLDITEDEIKENITLVSENSFDSERIYNYAYPTPAFLNAPTMSESYEKLEGVEYYETEKVLNSMGYYNYNMQYTFLQEDYENSNVVSNSVSVFNVYNKGRTYYIETGANIKAFSQMNGISTLQVVVNLDDNLEVVSSNADLVSGNTLTWNIPSSDAKTTPISLAYKKIENSSNSSNSTNSTNSSSNELNNSNNSVDNKSTLIIALLCLLGFGLVLTILIIIKNRRQK